ncbi:Protein FAR1-RELATED SEQUENCE 5 [Rhynchospora pubera]|uniref:Protein FAR1-RELATED SEQUENCE n=1 Tax=Rhynchospora pubera TaxID=906938 RepID=A0AAV8CIS0_9POAL|nr:Protein FAR1-RELATED SEQUENCE 5 [Rhynchospora pubera]
MENASSEDEGSLRDNSVDLNDGTLVDPHQLELEVTAQLAEPTTSATDPFSTSDEPKTNNTSPVEPFIGMEFESEEAAKLFYMAYASQVGFSVRISKSRRSRNDESIIMRRFVCSKEGFHLKKSGDLDEGKKKRKRATIREGCNAMIEVIQKYYGRWVVSKLVKEHTHIVEPPSQVRFVAPEEYAHADPYLGMEFSSHEAAQTFYYAYASRVGFDVRIRLSRRSTKDESFVMRRFVCTKEGFTPSEENGEDVAAGKKKRSRTPVREGCKAMFEVIRKDFDKWIVSKLVLDHTHELAIVPSKVHYIQSQSEVVVLSKAPGEQLGMLSTGAKPAAYDNNIPIWNERKSTQHFSFSIDDTQKLLGYFKRMNGENNTFSYAYRVDNNNCLTHAFWADVRARGSYYYFGDAVTIDMDFKADLNMLPFVMLTGVNHHFQSVLFGCALLVDQSEESFVWLLENWVTAMGAHHPGSLKTMLDEAISSAVSRVFPETRHRFCLNDMFSKCAKRLANIYSLYPSFEEEFKNAINTTESIEEFEFSWNSLLRNYDLGNNNWIQYLYNIREKWVPAFLKGTFTAEIVPNLKPESLREVLFKKYFNKKTPLPVFITLLDQAMIGWSERESLEDLASSFTKPILDFPSNLLKQVSEVYTRSVYNIFEREFVDSLGYYVEKIEDGLVGKFKVIKDYACASPCTSTARIVTYDFSDKRVRCSCGKFEECGILCRHILRVFLTVDVRTLPELYVLKRWTKDAKSGFVLDEVLRFNNLYRDAVRFAREGSSSDEVFNLAQQHLQLAYAEVMNIKQRYG